MLSKKVCEKCYLQEDPDTWRSNDGAWRATGLGAILCPLEGFKLALVKLPPPDWCMHKFEHAVAAGRSEC